MLACEGSSGRVCSGWSTLLRPGLPRKSKAKQPSPLQQSGRRAAEKSGVALSDWEGEFLGSVEGRVEKYGRAFRDREKGAPNASLSLRQTVKLKEISAKARGKRRAGSKLRRKPFGH